STHRRQVKRMRRHEWVIRPYAVEWGCPAAPGKPVTADTHRRFVVAFVACVGCGEPVRALFRQWQELGSVDQAGHLVRDWPGCDALCCTAGATVHGALGATGLSRSGGAVAGGGVHG